ncbi:hypothetical protein N9D31_01995 [Oligoflexaceae bacterium]|nr:hypothetical protein [Oligoflexaceae bacterium]
MKLVLLIVSVSFFGNLNEVAMGAEKMEKVKGIGGFFFRSENSSELAKWYLDHLGIDLAPQHTGTLPWQQEKGFTVFDPFPEDSSMIPKGKTWMINFRVNNLNAMVEQLRKAGVTVEDPQVYPHGKFSTLNDPEGNGIQLWEPPEN